MGFEEHKRKWVFFFTFVLLLILAFFMFRPYLNAVIVGALFAYFLHPLYLKTVKLVKSKVAAQIILSLGAAFLLIGLLVVIAVPLASQSQQLYQKSGVLVTTFVKDIRGCNEQPSETPACRLSSFFSPLIESPQFKQRSNELLQKTSLYIYEKVGELISGLASFIVFFIIMIFSLFYFLDHGLEIKNTIAAILPLSKYDKQKIMIRLEESIRAVVGGSVMTAFLQGVAASLIFFLLDVSSPLFWGLIVSILAFIPGIGPSIVWIPLAIIFALKGDFTRAIVLVAYALLVLTSIESLLKPKIIGDKIKMSTYAIFMGVLGGLHLFGILGFFFGPILLALLITCIQIYREMDGHSSQ